MKSSPFKYIPFKQDVDASRDARHILSQPRLSGWTAAIAVLALLVAAASGGYALGQRSNDGHSHGLLAPVGDKMHVFTYDRTFAKAPTEQTADAWDRLFPRNGGFIHHPELASNFSGIAVFHQLHCLEALYYLYYDATGEGNGGGAHHHHDDGAHQVTPPAHARHCFDYLRQSLMCLADTNLEQYNYTVNGVTGWGKKQCRDYSAVMRFAEQWGGNKWA